jgi:hypothetical protein
MRQIFLKDIFAFEEGNERARSLVISARINLTSRSIL